MQEEAPTENEGQMRVIQEQEKRIRELEEKVERLTSSLEEVLKIVQNHHSIINKVPVNRTNWVIDSPTSCWLRENGLTYVVESSSTYQSLENHMPKNLFTKTEGETSRWATEIDKHNDSWVRVEYPERVKINYLRIKERNGCLDQCPTRFEIRGSNESAFVDGTFNVLASYEGIKLNKNEVKEFRFANENEYNFYTFFILSSNGFPCASLAELNFGYIT